MSTAGSRGAHRGGIMRLAVHLRPVRGLLLTGISASFAGAVMQWLAPWPLKVIFDSVLAHHRPPRLLSWMPADPSGRLVILSVLTVLVAALLGGFGYLADRKVAQAGQQVVFAIRTALFGHLLAQSPSFHQRRRTGDLMSRLDGDIQQMQAVMVDAVPTVVNNIATVAGFVVIIFFINVSLGLVTIAVVPTLYLLVRYFHRRIKGAQRTALRAQGDAAATAQEALTSLHIVQAFGAEEREAQRYGQSTGADLRASLSAVVLQSAFSPLVAFVMTVMTTAVVYLGARAALTGQLTAGDLIVFTAYLRGMYTPVRQLAKLSGSLGRAQAAAERVTEILDTQESVPEPASPMRIAKARGHLTFEGVSFRHPQGEPVLDGIDLDLPAGTRLALAGPTGTGKSTLLRLVPRFIDPTAGTVRLDGIDLRDLSIVDLRRQISLVPQEPYLFNATVWQNIAYGQPGATRADAIAAAAAAGVGEVLAGLPQGFDTVVAERASSLSGGQRQCVALARAMVRNAPILLLDEPTTGLDVGIEELLLDAFDRLGAGRTTLLVSHQASALNRAERIVVLTDGHISERHAAIDLIGAHRPHRQDADHDAFEFRHDQPAARGVGRVRPDRRHQQP
jgi:ATP-binding cassette, subfamily B, bacterial